METMLKLKYQMRSRLQNGESIKSVCEDYGVSFNELVGIMKRNEPLKDGRKHKSTKELYISRLPRNNFVIWYKDVYFGSYYCLEDAVLVRDRLIECDWDKSLVDSICESVGVVRRRKGKKYGDGCL